MVVHEVVLSSCSVIQYGDAISKVRGWEKTVTVVAVVNRMHPRPLSVLSTYFTFFGGRLTHLTGGSGGVQPPPPPPSYTRLLLSFFSITSWPACSPLFSLVADALRPFTVLLL
eukprot:RCo029590